MMHEYIVMATVVKVFRKRVRASSIVALATRNEFLWPPITYRETAVVSCVLGFARSRVDRWPVVALSWRRVMNAFNTWSPLYSTYVSPVHRRITKKGETNVKTTPKCVAAVRYMKWVFLFRTSACSDGDNKNSKGNCTQRVILYTSYMLHEIH